MIVDVFASRLVILGPMWVLPLSQSEAAISSFSLEQLLTSLSSAVAVLAANVGAEGAWLIAEEEGAASNCHMFLWLCLRFARLLVQELSGRLCRRHGRTRAVWVLLPFSKQD